MRTKLKMVLTWKEGCTLSISAVIGCGILVLPTLTAQQAGPASLLVWLVISLLSFPIVFVLSKLAAKIPKAGGISSYAEIAFGPQSGMITSWILMGSIPIGVPAVALSGAYYFSYIVPLSFTQLIMIASIMLFFSIFLNIQGINLSSKISTSIVTLIILILFIVVLSSIPHVRLNNFIPFAPYDNASILSLFPLIFFAYAGFELICPLAEEFKNPVHDIPISLFLSALFITFLYLSISWVTIGTNIYNEPNSITALSSLIALSFGKTSGSIIAILTILITFCSIHANIAGFSRIIYHEARDGEFPQILAQLHPKHKTPINALLALGSAFAFVLCSFTFFIPDLNQLLKFPGSVFLFSYVISMAAGIKLLDKRSIGWVCACVTFCICSLLFLSSGLICLFPVILGLLGFCYLKIKSRFNVIKQPTS
ncbi:MAG: amino acid permease [Firmicutes bacterium]|nr:amino acid permease [Bacillota bacterium]